MIGTLLFFVYTISFCADSSSSNSYSHGQLQQLLNQANRDVQHGKFEIDVPREIVRGARLHLALINSDQEVLKEFDQSAQAVRSLVWWLYALGQKSFCEGTFVVQDTPDNKILNYLQELPNVYPRSSTHFTHEKEPQWGFDIDDLPTQTPKRTLLFGKAGSDMQENKLIFIKPESWGTATWKHFILHSAQMPLCVARKIPLLQCIAGTDDADGYQKERIPNDVWARFVSLIDELDQVGVSNVRSLIDAAEKRGIAFMVESLRLIKIKDVGVKKIVAEFITDMNERFDHVSVRYGNEVVITHDAIKDLDDAELKKLFQDLVKQHVLGIKHEKVQVLGEVCNA